MIKYALCCANLHQWDAWFDSIAGYDDQHARGLVECPFCTTTAVTKAPMAPAVRTSRALAYSDDGETEASSGATDMADVPAPVPASPNMPSPLDGVPPPVQAMMAHIVQSIKSTHEDVGKSFAREVRAMHDGQTDHRPIYGTATTEEVTDLLDDDIPIMPLPLLGPLKDEPGIH
jgi:hypothetical protein